MGWMQLIHLLLLLLGTSLADHAFPLLGFTPYRNYHHPSVSFPIRQDVGSAVRSEIHLGETPEIPVADINVVAIGKGSQIDFIPFATRELSDPLNLPPNSVVTGSPSIDDDMMFVPIRDPRFHNKHSLLAYSLNTLDLEWRVDTALPIAPSPLTVGSSVVTVAVSVGKDLQIVAFSQTDGLHIWNYTSTDGSFTSTTPSNLHRRLAAAHYDESSCDKGCVVVQDGGRIVELSLDNYGHVIWQSESFINVTNDASAQIMTSLYQSGHVIVASENKMTVVDAENGSIQRTMELPGRFLYMAELQPNIIAVAFKTATGDQISYWDITTDALSMGQVFHNPVVGMSSLKEKVILVTTSHKIFVLGSDFSKITELSVGGQITSTPLVTSNLDIIVTTDENTLEMIHLSQREDSSSDDSTSSDRDISGGGWSASLLVNIVDSGLSAGEWIAVVLFFIGLGVGGAWFFVNTRDSKSREELQYYDDI